MFVQVFWELTILYLPSGALVLLHMSCKYLASFQNRFQNQIKRKVLQNDGPFSANGYFKFSICHFLLG